MKPIKNIPGQIIYKEFNGQTLPILQAQLDNLLQAFAYNKGISFKLGKFLAQNGEIKIDLTAKIESQKTPISNQDKVFLGKTRDVNNPKWAWVNEVTGAEIILSAQYEDAELAEIFALETDQTFRRSTPETVHILTRSL